MCVGKCVFIFLCQGTQGEEKEETEKTPQMEEEKSPKGFGVPEDVPESQKRGL